MLATFRVIAEILSTFSVIRQQFTAVKVESSCGEAYGGIELLPLRVVFVPHWKYLDNTRISHLHVPTGYGSWMFTHLPSRTVFIDNDRYQGEEWLRYWMAHESGHLKTKSVHEADAERAAREFRKRLKDRQCQGLH